MEGFCWVFPFNILFLVVYLFPEWSQIKPIQSKYQFIFWECWFEKKGGVCFLLEISQPHIRCSNAAAWKERRLYVFMQSEASEFFRVSLRAQWAKELLACVLLTDLKDVKRACWLTGWDSNLNSASPVHLALLVPAPTLLPKTVGQDAAAWEGPLRTAKRLHLLIFFCKYHIMFLTQQLPRVVQRALWELGWMSLLGSVLSCQHLEARDISAMISIDSVLGDAAFCSWGRQSLSYLLHTHIKHTGFKNTLTEPTRGDSCALPHVLSFAGRHTRGLLHSHTHRFWLAHNGQLMSLRPSGYPLGVLQLWPPFLLSAPPS